MDYVQDCPIGIPYVSTGHLYGFDSRINTKIYHFMNIGDDKYINYEGLKGHHIIDKNCKAKVMRVK